MRVAVVSPHLDDGVLSLGATISGLVRCGHDIDLVTVFAGNLALDGPASYWDAKRALPSKAEVFVARRNEDQRAAERLGATPFWLEFDDDAYLSPRDPDAVWSSLSPVLARADAVLVPGFPLAHSDHRFVTMLVLDRIAKGTPLYFYAELPYASRLLQMARSMVQGGGSPALEHALGEPMVWERRAVTSLDRSAKRDAMDAYSGELPALGLGRIRVLSKALAVRGERLAHPKSAGSFTELVGPAS